MNENVFSKKRRKVNLHSTTHEKPTKIEKEKAKPKSFSVFKHDLKVLEDLRQHLEDETGQRVTKSFAMRMGIYYLEQMLKANDGLDEEMQTVLRECQKMKQIN